MRTSSFSQRTSRSSFESGDGRPSVAATIATGASGPGGNGNNGAVSISKRAMVASYVRRILADRERTALMVKRLNSNLAFTETDFAAVVMIDVSGYSALTTALTSMGKYSSEIITRSVGGYLSKITEVVCLYGGDIIKFLGDAILISFAPERQDTRLDDPRKPRSSAPSEHEDRALARSLLVRRACVCCLHIMLRYPAIDIEVPNAAATRARSNNAGPPGSTVAKPGEYMNGSTVSGNGGSPAQSVSHRLTLHAALTAGEVEHVIVGRPSQRMDYYIHGECLDLLGDVVDHAKSGEFGVSTDAWAMLGDPPGSSPFVSALQTPNIDGGGNAEAGLGEGGLAEMESHARRNESDRVVPSDILASLLECLCGARGWERLILSGRWGDTEISEALLGSTGWRVRGEALRQGLTAAGKSAVQEAVFEKMVERFSNESIIYKINKRKEAVDKGVVDIDKDGEHDSDEEVEGETVSESATDSDGGEPPGPVMARNRQPSGGYEIKGEFRTVSVMFACFNPGPDTEKAQKATALLLSALKKHGGIFSQYSVDDKGHTLLSLFGLPPFSHEQDAMNALRAGVLFLSLMDKSHMPAPTIGVATGEVLFTVSGAPARMDASFRGDVVNLSARLLGIGKICKVGIVCDYATRAACGPLDLEDLGVHVVKGKVMPIRVFGCDARSFLRHDRALGGVAGGNRVIGYRKEKNGILDTFQGWCKEGGPAVMVVEGMSGMGKSSLLEHVKTVAKDFLVPFCITRGSEIDRRTPYSSVSTLMSFIYHHSSDNAFGSLATMSQSRAMYSSTPTLRNQTVYAKISKEPSQTGGLSGDLAAFAAQYDVDKDLAPLLYLVMPWMEASSTQAGKKFEGRTKRIFLVPIIVKIVTAFLEKHRLVFLLDDSQWFDAASNEIFLELVKCSTQGFFVFFTRPAPDNAVLQEITQMPHCTHMVLKGFAAEDVAELMINVFKDDGERIERIDENITNAIFERCGGSPLFASMIITSIQLRHRDVCLVSEDGTLHVNSDIKDVRTLLLESVGAAITFQLDRLDPTFHDALKCGSIFGQDFDLEDLRVLIGSTLTSQELGEWMQMCDVFHFLQWSAVDDDDEESLHCTFRHITIMQVVYESQGFADRAILHQRAAERFEAMMSESNRDVLLPLVSYHFSNSDVQAKNVKYAEELGLKHMADYHLADLIMVFRSLLDHSKDGKTGSAVASDCGGVDLFPDSRLSLWHAALGFAFVQQAEWDMGELHTVEALKLLGIEWPTARNEKRAMQKAMMLQLRLFIKTKGGLKPLRDDDKIYQGRALLHNKAYRIVLENLQKTLFYCSSRFSKEKFVMIFFWSLNWAIQMCGEEPEHWCAFSFMAAKQLLWKSGKISSIYLKKGYAFLEKAGDSTYTGRAYLSSYLMEVVRFKESESILKEVEQYNRKIGNIARQGTSLYALSFMEFLRGETESAYILPGFIETAFKVEPVSPTMCLVSLIKISMIRDRPQMVRRQIAELGQILDTVVQVCDSQPQIRAILLMFRCWSYLHYDTPPRPSDALACLRDYMPYLATWLVANAPICEANLFALINLLFLAERHMPHTPSRAGQVDDEHTGQNRVVLTKEEAAELNVIARQSLRRISDVGRRHRQGIALMHMPLFEAASILIGARSKGRDAAESAVKVLRKALVSGPHAKLMDGELKLIGMYTTALIGVFLSVEGQKKEFLEKAKTTCAGMDSAFFAKWIQGHLALL